MPHRKPPIPANETERLTRLVHLNVLDSKPDRYLDNLALLASQLCGTPIAMISLVDKDRQWFKAKIGIEEAESPRDISFCAHCIAQDEVFVIEDATTDDRFKDNPFVTGPLEVRFYAAAPLKTRDGYNIGTLCVVDSQPRKLSADQAKILQTLAQHVILSFEHQRLEQDLLQRERDLQSSLQRALNSEAWFRTIFEETPVGLIRLDRQFRFLSANPAYCRMVGYSEEELINGKSVFDITHPDDHELTHNLSISDFEIRQFARFKKRYLRKDGEIVWVAVTTKNIRLENEVLLFSVIEDITEYQNQETMLKEAQAQMVAASKMAMMGEVAGGIAHEINNPLATIQARTSLLSTRLSSETPDLTKAADDIEMIQKTIVRIAKIIKGLRYLSRNADHDPMQVVSFRRIVDEILEIIRENLRKDNIDVRLHFSEDLTLECRPTQISQVLMNLLVNSVDAITDLTDRWVEIEASEVGPEVVIRFSDSGAGIPPATVKKLMQPFFTTKEPGKGTGLGLSISKGIAESHHGSFRYDADAPNTTFELRIPKTQPAKKTA